MHKYFLVYIPYKTETYRLIDIYSAAIVKRRTLRCPHTLPLQYFPSSFYLALLTNLPQYSPHQLISLYTQPLSVLDVDDQYHITLLPGTAKAPKA